VLTSYAVSQTATRQTAEERRETVLEAARVEFAQHGFHGASTDAIARRAGISQPYLFRLFGSKKALFVAVNDMCFQRTLDLFREAAAGTSGQDALDTIGQAYGELIESDRTMLQGQLQAYSAAVNDEEIRAAVARGYGRLVDYVEAVSGADKHTLALFFAKGMLMNTLAAMDYSIKDEPRDSWAARLAEGCRED
jgi:AcrR family transcriptional regulator